MLPSEFYQFTSDPVELHDSKIQNVTVNESLITMRLHGDDNGGLRIIDIQYDCNGLTIPDIPSSLLENNPDCELMCHEFLRQDHCYEHRMMFANGTELRVQFNHIMANVTPDHEKTE